ncbi:hypothetical protein [Plesiomonas shigelloides]|uniref:hypothetical protein n=1 Tax=Plesiomonas shigelloides TaxID=703 RepID=UPI00111BFDA3|nr:hypothetical protein [Plesiomonas shigelloides]
MQITTCDGVIDIIDGASRCNGTVQIIEAQSIVYLTPQGFDMQLASLVIGGLLLSFVTGHFGGRVVRWLGKL